MVYVVVKNLEYGVFEVMLFVCDFCGRICKVYCKNNVLGSLDFVMVLYEWCYEFWNCMGVIMVKMYMICGIYY